MLMASVREALGRFNIVPSLDFENEALVDIPVSSSFATFPKQPEIEINRAYNPFNSVNADQKNVVINRFEREKSEGWEKLYGGSTGENETSGNNVLPHDTQRKILQIKNKYLICPVKSGLMIIDQKRAHERILFERYLYCLSNSGSVMQTTMFPVTIDLTPSDINVLREIEPDLVSLGFDINHTGERKITLNGYPDEVTGNDPGEVFMSIIAEYRDKKIIPGDGKKEMISAAMARAAAIPYGKALNQSEMENLFDTLFACSAPNYSPSGKPVISIFTSDELDKRFK